MKRFSDLIAKSAEKKLAQKNSDDILKGRFKIAKSDDEKMLAFGWASVSMRVDGELIEDWQKDIVEPEELEKPVLPRFLPGLSIASIQRKAAPAMNVISARVLRQAVP